VRSAMVAMLALAFVGLLPAPAFAAADEPRITVAMLPPGTEVGEIAAAVPEMAPGVMSAGLGRVPAAQTYLDIGQGNRLFTSLYPEPIPPLYVTGGRVPADLWARVVARAEEAPADLEPGLLGATLEDAGVEIAARPLAGSPALIAADRDGRIDRTASCDPGVCPGVNVLSAETGELPALADRLRPGSGDLLIAIERPPPERDLLAVGVAGEGFEGKAITSDSTRMDGYVLATDLLPTILERYGLAIPDGVDGRAIVPTSGGADVAAIADLESRLGEVSSRRWEVLAVNLLIWVAAGLVLTLWRRRLAGTLLAILATAMAIVPAILLLAAALSPSELGERIMVGAGAPLLALLAIVALRGPLGRRAPHGAFALAATVSILATAADVVLGSPLTAVSLLGPNPGLGVRFFGIGNELEAALGAMLLLAVGSTVTAVAPRDPRRAVAIAVAVVTVVAVLVFAPGRFGADVGAAITFPAGAAATVVVALRLGFRKAALVIAAPIVALVALVLFDLVIPGDSHLTRSVLSAGGLGELGDVFDRRITLAARSFPRYLGSPFFIAALIGIAAAIVFRRQVISWFADRPAALAGTAGAVTATIVGTLANDSAALLLMVGTGYVAAYCGLAWGSRVPAGGRDTS
ncbi:MAG TPA: hypothetical protein VHI96_07830, partial [Solirubrobacterales bacterium]|nr:hypothetical protein [Solirubrobacterales bacterium]